MKNCKSGHWASIHLCSQGLTFPTYKMRKVGRWPIQKCDDICAEALKTANINVRYCHWSKMESPGPRLSCLCPVLLVMPFPGLASSGSRLLSCPFISRERQGRVLSEDWLCDLELISGLVLCISQQAGVFSSRGCPPNPQTWDFP